MLDAAIVSNETVPENFVNEMSTVSEPGRRLMLGISADLGTVRRSCPHISVMVALSASGVMMDRTAGR